MPSLQDQLLKVGMVDAKKAKRIAKEKRREAKQVKQGKTEADDSLQRATEQARADKLAKDREANRQRQQQAEQKAIAAQIKQLIISHRIERNNGDIGYQFVDGKKIKKLYVDTAQQRQLERGMIGIVRLDGQYELVNAAIANKIAERDPQTVIALIDRNAVASDAIDEDDPYAEFQIPDDLMW